MIRLLVALLATLLFHIATARAATFTADSARGQKLFEALSCVDCHSINGKGGSIGPDLGRVVDRGFTPASLAGTMWNHAPAMWSAMRAKNIPAGNLDEQGARDLFAYFYSNRYFEKPGDAGRGKHLFESKHCAECHGLQTAKLPAAKPVSQWASPGDPIGLIDAMWNHAATMHVEFDRMGIRWPELTSQDLTDILVYVRGATRGPTTVVITTGSSGPALFDSKGCAACHAGKLDLVPRLKNKTLTDIAAAMWDHQPKMAPSPPQLSPDEMRELISYLWAGQFFQDEGRAAAGAKVFTSKHCVACHGDGSSGAPKFPVAGRSFTAASLVAGLWRHGPLMLDQMRTRNIAWPRFSQDDMANLIAFLNRGK
jgi:mono/diheme cytochrome c family protein